MPFLRQPLAIALSVVLICLHTGCMVDKVKKLQPAKIAQPQMEHIMGVTTKASEEIGFDPPGGRVNQNSIEAKVRSVDYTVAINDIQRIWVQRRGVSAPRTIGLTAGIALATIGTLFVIAVALKQSCPFVYSWDGSGWVFDAEPYGGAITRGLERDDFSELEHLREDKGLYRLLLTNEVDETQYTNLMELWVVDHAPGSRVVSTETGDLRAFKGIQGPSAARDRDGNNLLAWLQSTDRKIWEPDAVPAPDGSLRQEIILTFPRTEGETRATLIANAATGLWGSYMIKKMVEVRGRDSANWLRSLDRDPAALQALHAWGEREGTYRLPIEVDEPGGWQMRGTLPGGGPLLAEDRAISLDLSRVEGKQLRIRLRPPVGFWAFNSFAISYGAGTPVRVNRVPSIRARTSDGKDILRDLAAIDDRYHPMPLETDRAEVIFPAPARKPGSDRTVFLHSRGWYELHLRDASAPDVETSNRLMTVPGSAATFAADRFAEWRQGGVR